MTSMTNKIDWQAALDGSRPVTTRDGRKVTLYCVDAPGDWPVHGRVEKHDDPLSWGWNGRYTLWAEQSSDDLIQQPRRFKYERWVNVYSDRVGGLWYLTRAQAAVGDAQSESIACIKIVVEGEEGEGLE